MWTAAQANYFPTEEIYPLGLAFVYDLLIIVNNCLQFLIPFLVKCLITLFDLFLYLLFSFSFKMSVSRNYIFQLWLFCFISFQNVSGIQINLTRTQAGDYFSNPYDDGKFCLLTNSMCYKNLPENGEKCHYCKCNESERTFDVTNLRCVPNEDSLNKGWLPT